MHLRLLAAIPIFPLLVGMAVAQPGAAVPLPTPPITGPLQAAPPIVLDAGPLGRLDLNGVVTGLGLAQSNAMAGDNAAHAALSNGQFFLQKPDGWWQIYVQAGAYNLLTLGSSFISTQHTVSELYGPVPVAYLKLGAKNTSIQMGALPSLMGAEWTFDFQNMNIERGLLWGQENSVNRGLQVNQTWKKLSASLSWNDGYYSDRYSWLSGALNFSAGPHTLSLEGMGNLSQTAFRSAATPVQNNSTMYALVYTYTKGHWIVQPYYQYSSVPTNPKAGVARGASTGSGAILMSYTFRHGLSFAGRGEYLATTGSVSAGAVNLLYGPGSAAWSLTVTPTWQRQRFFARGDVSLVRGLSITPGNAFGPAGAGANQFRGVAELGFLF
jgi:hypothetical protein